jgi:hypothetical protein
MAKKLITLEEHNKIKSQQCSMVGNGIACPDCGSELFDLGVSLHHYPPKYRIFCKNCNYKGTRL